MGNGLSKTQIDRLGDRLRRGDMSEADLRMLDDYRRVFSESYEFVVGTIRNELDLEPTGRPAKSTPAIIEKLHRESIRLSQIQDIAGCRLIVSDIADQEQVVDSLRSIFTNATLVDRRNKPSHGYRAVHLIVGSGSKLVEVQVRTSLQHLWAEWSEKLSDVIDPSIKYGGNPLGIGVLLSRSSAVVADEESLELRVAGAERRGDRFVTLETRSVISIEEWRFKQTSVKEDVMMFFRSSIESVSKLRQEIRDGVLDRI
jgi:GTP pyrophosphokinase